ncbi:MAG: recombination protein RecR [Bacilli bacterium]|nr:recombination protein RecR [Bacilli bacterium]
MERLKSLNNLIENLYKLPGVGKKSAERMAYAMLDFPSEDLESIAKALTDLKAKIHFCPICGMITDIDGCYICDDKNRDETTIMVVSYPKDVMSIEKSNSYKGQYHVLNGELSISKGMNTDSLNINSLLKRLDDGHYEEVILATNPTVDGETTSMYLAKLLEKYNIRVTRLAYGLQIGGNLDYVDPLTLSKALEGRHKI